MGPVPEPLEHQSGLGGTHPPELVEYLNGIFIKINLFIKEYYKHNHEHLIMGCFYSYA